MMQIFVYVLATVASRTGGWCWLNAFKPPLTSDDVCSKMMVLLLLISYLLLHRFVCLVLDLL